MCYIGIGIILSRVITQAPLNVILAITRVYYILLFIGIGTNSGFVGGGQPLRFINKSILQ